MATNTLNPSAAVGRRPLQAWFVPIPVTCFIGTLVTDLVYWRTAEMMWADFSSWLVTIGAVACLFAVIAGLVDLASVGRRDMGRPLWPGTFGYALVLVVSIFNALVHSRDAWTSVVPMGLILSACVVLLLLVVKGMDLLSRHPRHD